MYRDCMQHHNWSIRGTTASKQPVHSDLAHTNIRLMRMTTTKQQTQQAGSRYTEAVKLLT